MVCQKLSKFIFFSSTEFDGQDDLKLLNWKFENKPMYVNSNFLSPYCPMQGCGIQMTSWLINYCTFCYEIPKKIKCKKMVSRKFIIGWKIQRSITSYGMWQIQKDKNLSLMIYIFKKMLDFIKWSDKHLIV